MRARAVIEEKESGTGRRSSSPSCRTRSTRREARRGDRGARARQEARGHLRPCATRPSREGMRVVIELKRDAIPRVVLNQLYKHTPMQSTFGVIMLALVPDPMTKQLVPKVMALQGDARALHRAPARSRSCAAPQFELGQGAGARAHPRRAEDRRRQHRRGDQAHPRLPRTPPTASTRAAERASSCRNSRPKRFSTCASRSSPAWRSTSSRQSSRKCRRSSRNCVRFSIRGPSG